MRCGTNGVPCRSVKGIGMAERSGRRAPSPRRPDLQGMRAIAVLTVFADHLFGWPRGGFVGVDIFFVLSGFFITGLLIRERTTTGHLSFQNFYTRRVKRILPSALLVLSATVAGSYALFPSSRAKDTLVDALYAALFSANWRFQSLGADYFQQGQPPSPIQHYWSLSIEEQFYFVWPLLLVGIFFGTRRFRPRDYRQVRESALATTMTLIVAASFGWAMYQSSTDPNDAYFSTFTRTWELGVGALLAIAGSWLIRIPSQIRPGLAYLGLAGVVASLFVIGPTTRWPAPWAALPVLATALVVASFHGVPLRGMLVLNNPVMRWFGDTSYTLYLWHWPIITLLLAVMPIGPLFYIVALTSALGLTAITFHFYEDPIRKSRWLLDKPGMKMSPRLWAGIGACMVAVMAFSILSISANERAEKVTREIAQASKITQPLEERDPCFGASAMVTPGCPLRNAAKPLEPSIDTFADDGPASDCNMWGDHATACQYGYVGPDAIRIALIGDSHAEAFQSALWPILNANKWSLTTYVGFQCILADPSVGGCDQALPKVKATLVDHPYDLLLVTNFDNGMPVDRYRAAWDPILKAGGRIAVIRDNPPTTADALACLTRVSVGGDKTGECGASRSEAFRNPESLPTAAAEIGTMLIDLTQYYCTIDRCPSVIGDVIVYRDVKDGINSHLTATYAATLAPYVEAAIKKALA